jgi:hypothetical protein
LVTSLIDERDTNQGFVLNSELLKFRCVKDNQFDVSDKEEETLRGYFGDVTRTNNIYGPPNFDDFSIESQIVKEYGLLKIQLPHH